MTVLQPLTALDAVNMMLSSIGQAPVNTLEVVGIRDVSIAKLILDNTTREILNRGWSFNTDTGWPLPLNESGNAVVPENTLAVSSSNPRYDYVVRSNSGTMMLYDRHDQTFEFSYSPIRMDIIWAMDFEEVPQAARGYIATRAARLFQAQVLGSQILFHFTDVHETEAYGTLRKMESRSKNRNMFRTPNEENASILHRRHNPVR